MIGPFAGCNDAEINRICDPALTRNFNVVYNAHFPGTLTIDNQCGDTAIIYRSLLDPVSVLPGGFTSLSLVEKQQYLVEVNCADSSLTYQFLNECP